jgi:hypothetical protein
LLEKTRYNQFRIAPSRSHYHGSPSPPRKHRSRSRSPRRNHYPPSERENGDRGHSHNNDYSDRGRYVQSTREKSSENFLNFPHANPCPQAVNALPPTDWVKVCLYCWLVFCLFVYFYFLALPSLAIVDTMDRKVYSVLLV